MLTLYVDGPAWRAHLASYAESHPGLVPVVKGNGYGFGLHRLARRTQWLADRGLGGDTIAVGTYEEIEQVSPRFDGSVLVLTAWRPFVGPSTGSGTDVRGSGTDVRGTGTDVRGSGTEVGGSGTDVRGSGGDVASDPRVVHTVSRVEDLRALGATGYRPRVVLEPLTTMRRHGLATEELREASAHLQGVRLEGVSMHFPLTDSANVEEADRLLTEITAAGLPTTTAYVSHLGDAGAAELAGRWPEWTLRPRVGTALWLGAPEATSIRAHVLDVHALRRGEVYGYRRRKAPRDGHLLVVSGGTSHGVGLDAPTPAHSLRARAATLAKAGIEASGMARSPFVIGGRNRLFAEPPHMQASMLFVSGDTPVPAVGDEVEVRLRYTTVAFDRVVVS